MDYAVVGGDARFAYLTKLLCACGYDARASLFIFGGLFDLV